MISFRTEIPPLQPGVEIAHQHQLLCIGSCFAEHIGSRLEQLKFQALVNPFGIIFNPVSIVQVVKKLISETIYTEKDLFENLGLWHSYDHHGRFSHPDPSTTLQQINQALKDARQFLSNTDHLLLTLGTANVFVDKRTNTVVANCHKMPGQTFARHRLSVEEVATPLISILQKLKDMQPNLEAIVTVSPVRHLRDGLLENQRSKATLLLGLEAVSTALPFVHYFPSYEMVLDDLRDYRFYEKDLSHPNSVAIDYIWNYFENAFFTDKTKALCQRISQLSTAATHRPFHPTSEAHQTFLRKQLLILEILQKEFPSMDFTKEKEAFSRQLL